MKRVLYFLSLGVFLYSCKSKETVTPNRPPSAFTVTPTLKSDGKTIVLNWTKAKDPDGDAVTYAVVLKDTLVKNINDTTYTIASLDFNYSQEGKVIAKDAKGLISEASFTATTQPNHPPTSFTVTPTLQTDGKTIILNWTAATDPNGGKVTYCVVLKDTLAKNISTTTYTITSLNFGENKTGKIIAKNARGLTSETAFTATTKVQSFVGIPDANFEKYLVEQKIDTDGLINGKMNIDDSKGVTEISVNSKSIKSLAGIEVFTDLQALRCSNNQLTTLDVSKNVNLYRLFCPNNQLTTLDVNKNLQALDCSSNQLTILDVRKNIDLLFFDCSKNQIKTICVADINKANSNSNWQKDTTATYSLCK